jgi:microcystin-dependent protein
MPGFPVPFIKFREDDANGFPLAAGKLYSYAAGTSTPLATYSTYIVPPDVLAVPNANPTILDASGRASIYIPDGVGYKFILKDTLDNTIWTEDNVQVPDVVPPEAPSEVPPGGIVMYGGLTAPAGWLLCDGAAVNRFTNSALFGVIGETFGAGNGSTTFNVPDFRQRFPLGVAASGTGNVLGGTGGTIDHKHTGAVHTHAILPHTHPMAAHTHTVSRTWAPGIGGPLNTFTDHLLTSGGGGGGGYTPVNDQTTTAASPTDTSVNTVGLVTENGGAADTSIANPPFVAVNFIIKT